MANNFDKFAILDSFLDEVNSYLPDIQSNLDRLQQNPGDMDTIEETYRRTHTIAGSAAMMEFTGLAHVAQGMEDTLGEALDTQANLDAPTIALLRRSFTRLSRLVEQVKSGADDAPVVAEDDADRAASRGKGAHAAAQTQYSVSNAGDAAFGYLQSHAQAPDAASDPAAAVQIPDWLAAFAAPASSQPPVGPAPELSGSAPSSTTSAPDAFAPFGPLSGENTSFAAQNEPTTLPPSEHSAFAASFGQGQPTADPFAASHAAPQVDPFATSFGQPPQHDPFASSISQFQTSQTQSAAPEYSGYAPYTAPPLGGNTYEANTGQLDAQWMGSQAGERAPSLDEVMQSFQASAAPSSASDYDSQYEPGYGSTTPEASPVDAWAQSTVRAQPSWQAPSQPTWQPADAGGYDVAAMGTSVMPAMPTGPHPTAFAASSAQYPAMAPSGQFPADTAPAGLHDLQTDEAAVRRQVAVLSDVAASIHEAAQAMEDERSELRGFLDGSRDALDRLEEWAGQQMGLDLRQSPDSVRRYLPLSVIWVTTTRLKRLITLLYNSGRTVTVTHEQIEETLAELRATIANAGHVFSSMTSIGGAPDNGFSATVAHVSWAPPAQSPTPTYSSPAASGSSYAADERALSPGTRAEIERDVRDQLRRELEDDVRAEIAADVRREEEDRLRQELQIQVRRELLTELTPSFGASSSSVSAGSVLPHMASVDERAPKPIQVTSELSPEALEVFREEAQEHLQTITTGMAQLEKNHDDVAALQSIRRAMHTLKGAAGMMGFTNIQQIAHASEDLLDGMVENSATLTPNVLSLLLDTSEGLDQMVSGVVTGADEQRVVSALTTRYAQVGGTPLPEVADLPAAEFSQSDATQVDLADEPDVAADPRATAETTPDLSVRLQLSKLDDLVNLFGELLINRSVLEERIDRLNRIVGDTVVVSERLREVGSQLETRFEAATLPSGRTGSSMGANGTPRDPAAGWASGNGRPALGGPQANIPAFANEFDELELDRYTEFHRLSRGLSEGVADVVTLSHEMETIIRDSQASFARENRLSSDFQDRLLKARLVPLQSMIPRLYRTTRASALREGKEIEFYSEGTDTEVDRKVFEEVAGPLLHLVRNSVNHGIERPHVREMEGKPRAGKITVSAAYEGNQVVIAVRDDGGGIDPNKIRATAIARGWIDSYTQLSDRDAINLIFRPGVTTAESLTEEAGRGVGLDVVRDAVTRLRGTIEVDSVVGQGTTFTMKFPISLQIARAVLVKVGTQTLAIPMAVVDQIGRLDYYQRVPGPTPALEQRGERYPLAHLASYLKLQQGPIDERASVLLVNAGKRRVALLVDGIVAQQEIVAKPLGPHLRDVRGVAGAAVLGNGQVVLILELHEMLAQQPRGSVVLPEPGARTQQAAQPPVSTISTGPLIGAPPSYGAGAPPSFAASSRPQPVAPPPYQERPAPVTSAPTSPAMPSVPYGQREFVVAPRPVTGGLQHHMVAPPSSQYSHLLVVDDSPSVRRVVSNMLKAHGWEVQTARDGVEALEAIAREVPAAVLLDIEMPRMDGYELMATVRSQEQYRHLPLIVLTSRAATKHQQRALQLGADAYVVKPYQDEELLSTIATLVQARQ